MTTQPLTFVIPNHKADKDLGANSRATWRVIRRKQTTDKNLAFALLKNALNELGLTGEDYLTDGGRHPIEDALPIHVTFRRLYTGRAHQWDTDNLYSAYKGVQDGLKGVLGVDDRYFKTVVEQERDDFNELEISIIPAWKVKEEAA